MSVGYDPGKVVFAIVTLMVVVIVGSSVYPMVQKYANDPNVTGSPVAPVVTLIPLIFWISIGLGVLLVVVDAFIGRDESYGGLVSVSSTESEPTPDPGPTRCAYCGGKVHRVRRVLVDTPEPDLPEWLETCPWCYAPADKAFPNGVRE